MSLERSEAEHEAIGLLPTVDADLDRIATALPATRGEERILLQAAAILLRLVFRRLVGNRLR